MYPFHTYRDDVIARTSPAYSNETVGNSPKFAQTARRVQILERDGSIRADILGANRDDATEPTGSLDSGTLRFNDSVPQNQFRVALFGYTTLQPTAGSDTRQWTTTASTRKYISLEIKANTGGGGATNTVRYIHTDHLGGTSVVTDSSGNVVQTLDYYPYGSLRIDNTISFDERKKFTGYELDRSTGLNYAGARYQNPNEGRFISQDPAFLAVGSPELSNILTRVSGLPNAPFRLSRIEQERNHEILQQFLTDPQLHNSYSYARNNPVAFADPTGEIIPAFILGPTALKIIVGAIAFADIGIAISDLIEYKASVVTDRSLGAERSLSSKIDQAFPSILNVSSAFNPDVIAPITTTLILPFAIGNYFALPDSFSQTMEGIKGLHQIPSELVDVASKLIVEPIKDGFNSMQKDEKK